MNTDNRMVQRMVTGNRWYPILSIIALNARTCNQNKQELVTIGYRLPTGLFAICGTHDQETEMRRIEQNG